MTDQATDVERVVMIDGAVYVVDQPILSGADIRHLAYPPINRERDLWLEVSGGTDRLIGDAERVEITPTTRFFTSPYAIMAGSRRTV
ncbi:MAG: hypothetical protein QOE09_1360 [Ilumatobacteraceae bacterium]|jgi:hypothetical protein